MPAAGAWTEKATHEVAKLESERNGLFWEASKAKGSNLNRRYAMKPDQTAALPSTSYAGE